MQRGARDLGGYMRRRPDPDPELTLAATEAAALAARLTGRLTEALLAGDLVGAVLHAELISGQADDLVDRLRCMARLARTAPVREVAPQAGPVTLTYGAPVAELVPLPTSGHGVELTRASDGRRELVDPRRLGDHYAPPLSMLRRCPPSTQTVIERRTAQGHPDGWMSVRETPDEVARLLADAGSPGPEAA